MHLLKHSLERTDFGKKNNDYENKIKDSLDGAKLSKQAPDRFSTVLQTIFHVET